MNKEIKRDGQTANNIFDNRSLEKDYRTLVPILTQGMKVLDVGCGTGAISKDIARHVGPTGKVTGIDNTEAFIISGKEYIKRLRILSSSIPTYFNSKRKKNST